jgi:hypothetical protein
MKSNALRALFAIAVTALVVGGTIYVIRYLART